MNRLVVIVLLGKLMIANAMGQNVEVLETTDFAYYIDFFNSVDDESIKNAVPNAECWDWMHANIPWFECPDKEIDEIYYYCWWMYRKHIKETPSVYVITELLPEVGHSKKNNTIACAAGLHVDEGKWLYNKNYIRDYLKFWFSDEGEPRHYSSWFATSVYEYCTTIGDFAVAEELFSKLVGNHRKWEVSNLHL